MELSWLNKFMNKVIISDEELLEKNRIAITQLIGDHRLFGVAYYTIDKDGLIERLKPWKINRVDGEFAERIEKMLKEAKRKDS